MRSLKGEIPEPKIYIISRSSSTTRSWNEIGRIEGKKYRRFVCWNEDNGVWDSVQFCMAINVYGGYDSFETQNHKSSSIILMGLILEAKWVHCVRDERDIR